jgi:hypothetical protein
MTATVLGQGVYGGEGEDRDAVGTDRTLSPETFFDIDRDVGRE